MQDRRNRTQVPPVRERRRKIETRPHPRPGQRRQRTAVSACRSACSRQTVLCTALRVAHAIRCHDPKGRNSAASTASLRKSVRKVPARSRALKLRIVSPGKLHNNSTNRKKAVQDLSDSFYNDRHAGLLLPVSGQRGGARFGLRRKFRGLLLRRLRQFVPRFFGRGLSQLIPGPGHEFVPLFFGRLHAACHRHAAPRRAASTPDAPPRRSVSPSAPRRPRRSSDAVRRPPLRTERCP